MCNEISDDDDHMSDEDFDDNSDAGVSRNVVIGTEVEVESTVEGVANGSGEKPSCSGWSEVCQKLSLLFLQ